MNLKDLNASSNQLRNIQGIQKLEKLWYLNLGRNCLVSAGEIAKLKKLRILNLCFNKLSSLPDFRKIHHLSGFGIAYNHLSLEEISRKTPKYLFLDDWEEYLKVMALVQNVDYTLQFTEPSDITQIHKNMDRITGHAYMPDAVVQMIVSRSRMEDDDCEVILREVRVDENGDFVFDNLNFDQLEPGYDYFIAFDIDYDFYKVTTDSDYYYDPSLRWYRIN